MNKASVLVINSNQEILWNVKEYINSKGEWNATGASTDEEAVEKFHQQHFDLVLFAGDLTPTEKRKLNKLFIYQDPEIIIMEYHSDDLDRLSAGILEALQKREDESKPVISIIDDALKNAGLNIRIQ